MNVGEICTRDVVFCTASTPIAEAARLMREYHVGDLVVVEGDGMRIPLSILTDRDIVVEVVAMDAPLDELTAGDIQTGELITANERDDPMEVLAIMQDRGIRRIPVVDRDGALVGILALDDLLEILAQELGTMVRLIARAKRVETQRRPALSTLMS